MIRTLILLGMMLVSLSGRSQIVYADYSDPDVCEGSRGDYWLTASSFQCAPGLPILHSEDMQHWTLVNYALKDVVPAESYADVRHGCGVWAPCIRKHGDTYYIYWGDPDYGIFMVKTHDPASAWDAPVLVVSGKGLIDPSPLWDDDGRMYLVNGWANSRCGFNSILTVRQLSADGTSAVSDPVMVYDGLTEGNHTIEGPKFYKKDGWYYILAPAGGVEQGYQLALRSRQVYGPYESKVIFNKSGIHQGGWAGGKFICFQERQPYGRVLHLLDVKMKDGWPMMSVDGADKPMPLTYSAPSLAYQWHSNYSEAYGFSRQDGVRVYGHYTDSAFCNFWSVPNLYLKKFDKETFTDTLSATITANADGQQSGFIIMGRSYARLAFQLSDGHFLVKYITCADADKGNAEKEVLLSKVKARRFNAGAKDCYTCSVRFMLTCAKGASCTMAYSVNGAPYEAVPTTFHAREGKWIGAKYGVFSIAPCGNGRGWIDLKY